MTGRAGDTGQKRLLVFGVSWCDRESGGWGQIFLNKTQPQLVSHFKDMADETLVADDKINQYCLPHAKSKMELSASVDPEFLRDKLHRTQRDRDKRNYNR